MVKAVYNVEYGGDSTTVMGRAKIEVGDVRPPIHMLLPYAELDRLEWLPDPPTESAKHLARRERERELLAERRRRKRVRR